MDASTGDRSGARGAGNRDGERQGRSGESHPGGRSEDPDARGATSAGSPPDSRALRVLASPRFRLGLLAALLIGAGVAAYLVGAPSRSSIETTVRGTGAVAPLVFIGLYIALTVILIPGTILTAAGGVLFGTALGTLYVVIGATFGATAAFLLARRLGRHRVEAIAGRRIAAMDDWITRNGFVAVLYVRLIPVFPFNILNYAAGVTGVSARAYLLGTAIGIIPGTFAYAALGGSFDHPTSPEFLAAVSLIVVLAVSAPVVNRLMRQRGSLPEKD